MKKLIPFLLMISLSACCGVSVNQEVKKEHGAPCVFVKMEKGEATKAAFLNLKCSMLNKELNEIGEKD